MSSTIALHRRCKTASEVRDISVSFDDVLETGEAFDGALTVTEVGTTALTISNSAISSSTLIINGNSVAQARAVQFRVAGGTAGVEYTIQIVASTDALPAPGQTIYGTLKLLVIANTA